ncbi:abortive infection system antitoxin AbiGi family protein [Alistipes sp.]|uniref:abortive infection system antitoxin AbiGi family protein n=1 Tax=Alistipes sp. TaxID=1872444 RepID=UPI003AB301D3
MSTLSANTLFHFTRSKDTLINILKTRFYPRLCLEEIIIGTKSAKIAFPMVCFCDIPLSQIGNHASTYGKYAIGLKKEWAIKNGITPILYTHSTSLLCDNLRENLNDVRGKKSDNLFFNLIYTAGFIKPYSSSLSIKKKKIQVINYNEREWRYIPPKSILLSNNLTSYKDYAGGVLAVDISVACIYVVSLGKV